MGIFKNKIKNVMPVKEVDRLLGSLRLPVGLIFTPENLKEEMNRFFDSETYNPQFRYKGVKNSNEKAFEQLLKVEEVADVDPIISAFYLNVIQQKLLTDKMLNNVGNNSVVTEISLSKYRKPTPVLFRNACRVLRGMVSNYDIVDGKREKQAKVLEYDDVVRTMNKVLNLLGLSDWHTDKSKKIASGGARLAIKTKVVRIDPEIKKTPMELRKTIVHEIGTHLIRSLNGANSGVRLLEKPNLPIYLDAEEGLAMFNEEKMGVMSLSDLRRAAGFVWMLAIGENMTFRELFYAARALFPKKLAFNMTYRVKRGLGDTSKPGLYYKDVVYFRGFRKVRRFVEESPMFYDWLYAGKISLGQINWVEEGLIPKPKLVPTKEQFDKIFKEAGI